MLRATAEDSSLVACTDGPVLLLLDESPGRLLKLRHLSYLATRDDKNLREVARES